jgi:hypothetical protein
MVFLVVPVWEHLEAQILLDWDEETASKVL